MSSSESIDMYLITIAMLEETGRDGPIPLSTLADELSVQPVSVNQMIRKLDEEGLVSYQPYKGAQLTEEGRQQALHIIRHRRLWQVFFVEHLGLAPTEAEDLSCRMEHVTTDQVAENLFSYLKTPHVSPTGKPIPAAGQTQPTEKQKPLSNFTVGQWIEIQHLETDKTSAAFLRKEGLSPGVRLQIAAGGENGNILLTDHQHSISLAPALAEKIYAIQTEEVLIHAAS